MAFVAALSAQRRIQLLDRQSAALERLAPLMQRRVEAGASSPSDVSRIQAAAGFTRLERERARTALAVARRELSVLLGLDQLDFGSLNGDFRAVDRASGKVLWQRRLGSGIIGNPITYKVAGKQYVSVWSGIGGWIGLPVTAGLDLGDKFGAIGATAMTKAAGLNMIPQGGTLYTFAVKE